MNNRFDWNRFCKVVAKDFNNLWHNFGTTILILSALPVAFWLLLLVLGQGENVAMPADIRLIVIEALAALAAIMAPSRMYRTWNLRNEGIYYAMLPASKLEKFCSALIFSLVVCPLAVYLGGIVIDLFLTILPFGSWHNWIWQGEMGFPFTLDFTYIANLGIDEELGDLSYFGGLFTVATWASYICSTLLFVLTSTIFKRHKVLQTLLWMYLIEFVLSIVLIPIMGISLATTNIDWLASWVESDPQAVVNCLMWFGIGLDVLLAAIFGWLSWRRLDRMAY